MTSLVNRLTNQPGRLFISCALSTILMIFAVCAEAHNRSQSFSSWTLSGDKLDMVFTVKAREVTRLPPLEGDLQSLEALLLTHLRHSISVDSCVERGAPTMLPAASGFLRTGWSFDCSQAAFEAINLDSFFDVASSHVHYARAVLNEQAPVEYLFTDSLREHLVVADNTLISSFHRAFTQYTMLGMEHIFDGVDHIAFLLVLLLLCRRLREVIWMVSGFTLGHSLTLSLAAVGWIAPDITVIEALIGFTIAVVAVENIGAATGTNRQLSYLITAGLVIMALIPIGNGLPLLTVFGLALFTLAYLPLSADRQSAVAMRPLLTLAFGLIHGFGFASVLTEIGLPEQQLLPALLGFNVGVELGQLMIVAAVWYAAQWLKKSELIRNVRALTDSASAALCGLGLYWFVVRSFTLL